VEKATAKNIFNNLSKAIDQGLVQGCHDLSEGGLAVAAAEMAMGSGLGAKIFLNEAMRSKDMLDYEILFSESPTRFLVEVDKKDKKKFEAVFKGLPLGIVGYVDKQQVLVVRGCKNNPLIKLKIDEMRKAWTKTFDEFRRG
jgi:phosphoribosylformylglycinamidine synthase